MYRFAQSSPKKEAALEHTETVRIGALNLNVCHWQKSPVCCQSASLEERFA